MITITVCTFLIRIVQPIDTEVLNMQLCFFSQYITLFIVGCLSYRNNWFSSIDYKFGVKWLKLALSLGILIWITLVAVGGALDGKIDFYKGGMHWQSAAYALWESFVGVSMSIGLVTLFRQRCNKQGKLIKVLSDNSFAVYVFHAPVITSIAMLAKGIQFPPIVKFCMLCLCGIPITFVTTNFILRKTPLLKKVL